MGIEKDWSPMPFFGSGDCPNMPLALALPKISSKRERYSITKNRSRHTVVRSKEVATAR